MIDTSAIRAFLRSFRHRVAHFAGWNTGSVVSWWQDDGPYIGFQCSTCGRVTGERMRGAPPPKDSQNG